MANTRLCFEVHVSLVGTDPLVWRTFGVPADYPLSDIHEILQITMGWHGYHSHLFRVADKEFSSDTGLEDVSRQKLTLSTAFRRSPSGFEYLYDFGGGWRHEVKLLGRQKVGDADPPPMCWEGAMACPPEDVGGIVGFAKFLGALADPTHEEHESYLEWVGGAYDPQCFSSRQASAGLIGWWRKRAQVELLVSGLAEEFVRALSAG